MLGVPAVGASLWLVACLLLGAHSRYAIVPMLCCTWTVLVATDVVVAEARATPDRARWCGRIVGAVVVIVALGWARSWHPSLYRSATPSWRGELDRAAALCVSTGAVDVDVATAPQTEHLDEWVTRVPCDRLD